MLNCRRHSHVGVEVSQLRYARVFHKEELGFSIWPDLLCTVCLTLQVVLAYPPFSRLDFVFCRNLLIYLGPEAQAKTISAFHFALRDVAILLAVGTAIGIGASLAAGRLVTSLLFGVPANDPVALGGAAVVLVIGTAIAAYLPARRASNLDLTAALGADGPAPVEPGQSRFGGWHGA